MEDARDIPLDQDGYDPRPCSQACLPPAPGAKAETGGRQRPGASRSRGHAPRAASTSPRSGSARGDACGERQPDPLEGRPADRSHAGAMGLMQVMPGTYDELRYSAWAPTPMSRATTHPGRRRPISADVRPVRLSSFLGAYNAGPERYRQYVEEGRPLPRETARYMDIIAPQIAGIMPGPGRQWRPHGPNTPENTAQIQQKIAGDDPQQRADPRRLLAAQHHRGGGDAADPGWLVDPQHHRGAAMQPIPDGSSTRNTTVVAAMQADPGRVEHRGRVGTAASPVRVVQQPGVVRMQPIPDGASTQVAAALPVARQVARCG